MKLKTMSLGLALGILAGCQGPGEPETMLSLSIPLNGDVCGAASAEAWVLVQDGEDVGPVALDVSGDQITGAIEEVPAGVQVLKVEVKNKQQLVVYEGMAYVNVVEKAMSQVQLTLYRNLTNCPETGADEIPQGKGSLGLTGRLEDAGASGLQLLGTSLLPFRVIDAEYNRKTDEIIAVSDSPNRLWRVQPETGKTSFLELQKAPVTVSVAPSGTQVAVGHDGWLSVADLTTSKVRIFQMGAVAGDVILADNGYAYIIPAVDQWEHIHVVDLTTGKELPDSSWSIYAGAVGRLHPSGDFIYTADRGLSPGDIAKYSIQDGTVKELYDSPYHGDYAMCGNLWFSEDGNRIFTACGNVFRSSTSKTEDMIYNGKMDGIGQMKSLDHSAAAKLVAVIPGSSWYDNNSALDSGISLFSDDFLNLRGQTKLPAFAVGGKEQSSAGRFVFFSKDGTRLIALFQAPAESKLLLDQAFAVYAVNGR